MCLIAIAPAGTQKYSELFLNAIRKAAVSNTDGIGYSFKRAASNRVWIAKGFKDVELFINALKAKKLKDADELMVHLRIGNKGAKTTEMNHPFVVHSEEKVILTNDAYVKLPVMMHNGTFFSYSETNSPFSDTYFFVKKFASIPEIQQLLKRDKAVFSDALKSVLNTNKLCFIFPDSTPMAWVGDFLTEEGYYFSNKSYKEERYRNVGGTGYYGGDYHSEWEGGRAASSTPYQRNSGFDQIADRTATGSRVGSASTATPSEDESVSSDAIINSKVNPYLIIANSSRDIVPVAVNPKTFRVAETNGEIVNYRECVYVPLMYYKSQYTYSKWIPKGFNYKHFILKLQRNEDEYGGEKNAYYRIKDYSFTNNLNEVVPFSKLSYEPKDVVYPTVDQIIKDFAVVVRAEWCQIYIELFGMLRNYGNSTDKSTIIKLKDIISEAGIDQKAMFFGKEYTVKALKLYHNYFVESFYYNSESMMKYTVQEADPILHKTN